jgi:hypothetical protein
MGGRDSTHPSSLGRLALDSFFPVFRGSRRGTCLLTRGWGVVSLNLGHDVHA